jgi:hypothetical protein
MNCPRLIPLPEKILLFSLKTPFIKQGAEKLAILSLRATKGSVAISFFPFKYRIASSLRFSQ